MKNASPTKWKILSRAGKTAAEPSKSDRCAGRTRMEPPEIYVRPRGSELLARYHRAHLRNRGGYLYL